MNWRRRGSGRRCGSNRDDSFTEKNDIANDNNVMMPAMDGSYNQQQPGSVMNLHEGDANIAGGDDEYEYYYEN